MKNQLSIPYLQDVDLFRTLVEQSVDAMLVIDPEGIVRLANSAAVSMFGDKTRKLLGFNFGIPAIHEPVVIELTRGNETRVIEMRATEIQWKDKTLNLANFRDVTDHKRASQALEASLAKSDQLLATAEQTRLTLLNLLAEKREAAQVLKESEGRFYNAFEYSAFGIALVAPDGRWIRVNNALCEILGYSDEELLKTTFQDITHPDDLEADLAYVRQMLAGKIRTYQMEKRYFHKQGQIVWGLLSVSLVRDNAGQPQYFIAQIQDITERKRAEEALLASQEVVVGILNAMPIRVFWKDMNLVYLGCNAIFAADAGFVHPKEIIGKDDYQLGWRDQAEQYRKDDRLVIESGSPHLLIEEPQTTSQGATITLLTSKIPLRDSTGAVRGVLGTYMDITERKKAEENRLAHLRFLESMDKVNLAIHGVKDLEQMTNNVLETVLKIFECDRSWLFYPCDPDAPSFRVPMEITKPEYPGVKVLNVDMPIPPDIAENLREALESADPVTYTLGTERPVNKMGAEQFGVQSQMLVALRPRSDKPWAFGIHQCSYPRMWTQEEKKLFQEIGRRLEDTLTSMLAYREMRASEEKYRTIFENVQDTYAETAWDGTILEVSPSIEIMSKGQYHRDDLIGKSMSDLYYFASTRQALLALFEERGSVTDYEVMLKNRDGSQLPCSISAKLQFDAQGSPWKIVGSLRDITERKKAEDHLRQSEEQFRLIAENVADMIAVLDLDGRRIYNSPSYGSILGDPESLRGTDGFQEIHPDDVANVREVFQETVRTGVGQKMEYRLMGKDGSERTIASKGGVIRDRDGRISRVVVVSRDVTEEKRLAAQFMRAQRMESIGTLAGGIAHDLNNVLAPIMMAIEVLKNKIPDPGGQKTLATIETSAKRGADIVRQVLAFGRGVTGDRLLVQLKHIVIEVVKIAGQTFPKSIDIRTDIPRDLWTVSADPTQMHQVLLNMMVNARDAMPYGGALTISAENVTLDENYSRMNPQAKPGAYVCIVITDTGTGIPASIQEKIFEPFFTTKAIGQGTGLGLSTTLAIVKSHEGFITLHSEPGKGTTFRIYVPAKGTDPRGAAASEVVDLPTGHGELILIIDDEAAIREITKETLEAFGYKAMTASDGAEGVAIFAENKKNIKLVITDIMMPVMDGTAAIAALQRISRDVKIIAASGLTARGQVMPPPAPGVQGYLTKPYTAEKLLKTLRTVLG